MYKKKQEKDLIFGDKQEDKIKPILESHFKIKLNKTKGFATFDYIDNDENLFIELKSRRAKKYQYPDTMIGLNKVNEGFEKMKKGKKIYFFFSFRDQLCYYMLDNDTFNLKWIRAGGRKDRGINEIKSYVFIPVKYLTDVDQNIFSSQ